MQLRWYQAEAVQSLFQYWATNKGNPLIALPTGTGKSIVFAAFAWQAKTWYPQTRMLLLTHVKELISQNYSKLIRAWPGAPAGVYSAGIGRKETRADITFGGVQSVVNNVSAFGHIDLVGIDEAHLVSPDDESRYQTIIAQLKEINPKLKVFGMSATCWRNKQGMLTEEGGLFTDICYDRTTPADFQRFVAEGFLSPLVTSATQTTFDLSGVGIQNGDYNLKQLEEAVDKHDITKAALRETLYAAQNRRSWLLFCSGISHAEHVAGMLNSWGIRTACVHSKMSKSQRDEQLAGWFSGHYRAMTNNNVLTTGIDHPALDYIGMLRPTRSSSLWVQMLGRGMRVAPGKVNCLVQDFAGNITRLGPIDDPIIPGKPGKGGGDAPVRICPECNCYSHAAARMCEACGYVFPVEEKLTDKASDAPLMSDAFPVVETFPVTFVSYTDHMSKKGTRSIRITYHSGIRVFHEWINFDATAYQKHRANDWWKQRANTEPPNSNNEGLERTGELRNPTRLRVWVNRQYPEVLGVEWH